MNIGDLLGDLKTVEIGATLEIEMELTDIVNWAYQMTEFIGDDSIAEYLYFMATSLEANKSFTSDIGFDIMLKAFLQTENLVKMIAGDSSIGLIDALEGAKIYLEIVYDTNFHGEKAPVGYLWVEIKEGKLYLNLDVHELGDLVGFGDFFSYGVVDGLDISGLLGGATTASEASVSASNDVTVDTGILPSNIWDIINLILGRFLFANDFLSIGLNENLLADIVDMFMESDDPTLLALGNFLPKMKVTNSADTSGVTIDLYGEAPEIAINLGFKVGTEYYLSVSEYNAMYGKNGKYYVGTITPGVDWSGATYNKDGDRYVYAGTSGEYVLVTNDDYALVSYAYPNWQGDRYAHDAENNTFTLDANGQYLKQGDFGISIRLGGLYARFNKDDISVDKDAVFADKDADGNVIYDGNGNATYDKYVGLQEAKLTLDVELDVSMYGSGQTGDADVIDLSQILDLIVGLINPNSAVSGSTLKLNIRNALGNNVGPYLKMRVMAYLDLETFNVELGLELTKYETDGTPRVLAGIYLVDNNVYIDLSSLLGETAKLAVTGINLDELLGNLLGGLLGRDTQANGEAGVASHDDIATIEENMVDWAYLLILVNPQRIALQLNADLINAVYRKIMQIQGKDSTQDLLPDIGDLLIKADASGDDGTKLSLNLRLSDGLYFSIDIPKVKATKGVTSIKDEFKLDTTKFQEILALDLNALIGGAGFDLSSLNLPTIGLNAQLHVSFSAQGLNPTDPNGDYKYSIASWLGDLVTGLLDGTSLLGEFVKLTADEKNTYEGKRYNYDSADNMFKVAENGEYKFVSAGLDIYMMEDTTELILDIKANVNLGPVLAMGIGGILYSDIAIEIKSGAPTNRTILSLYYLGSSRLKFNDTTKNWELTDSGEGIFSDALYIDATGLGLGKIKFQGIAGLLGASPYAKVESSSATVASDATVEEEGETAADALYLQIDLENGRIGVSFDDAFITGLMGMLGLNLGFDLPEIQSVDLAILTDEAGIDAINLSAIIDSVGTLANISINPIDLTIGSPAFDSKAVINSVKKGYAGLTYSGTSGLMSLIQNVLDNLKPGLNIDIDNRVWEIVGTNSSKTITTTKEVSNISITGKKVFTPTNLPDNQGYDDKGYKLLLDLKLNRSTFNADNGVGLGVVVGGNNVFLTGIEVGGNLVDIISIVGAIQDLLNCLDLGSLLADMFPLKLVSGTDGDDAAYDYPNATTAGNVELHAQKSGWTTNDDGTRSYSYSANMSGLLENIKIGLLSDDAYNFGNLFGVGSGYNATTGHGKIALNIELDKDAYNELVLMIDVILLGLIKDVVDGKNNSDEPYFLDITKVGNSAGINGATKVYEGTNGITNLFNELDRLNMSGATTQEKVNLVEPYMRALPYALVRWIIDGVVQDLVKDVAIIGGMSLWGLFNNLASDTIANLSRLVGGILPIPFASGECNPNINIYIDLNPENEQYGISDANSINPGIQAIELLVNAERDNSGYLVYNKENGNKAVGTTSNVNEAWDFFRLAITPYSVYDSSYTSGALQFDDADSAASISSAIAPSEIVITDPATREGYLVVNGAQKPDFFLRDSYFLDETLFPQKANVVFPIKDELGNWIQSYYPGSPYQDATGTHIIWDAASVDLTAASDLDENGRRLAGYVYGYALNVVIYAIPVYVTSDFALQNVRSYEKNGMTYTAKTIQLDIDSQSNNYNAVLPDLVRIKFNAGTYTFATYLEDATGEMAYAVINQKGSSNYQEHEQPSDPNAAAVTNKDGGKYVLYPAYVAGLVKNADGSYATFTDSQTGMTYYVLDRGNLPTGKAFPAGTIKWDTSDFKYDFEGGEDGAIISVGYTYQWGLANAVDATLDIKAKNYKVQRLTSMVDNQTSQSVSITSEQDEDGNYTSVIKFNAIDLNETNYNIDTFIAGFDSVNGRFTSNSSFSGYDVEWDVQELTNAIANITDVHGNINYFNGLEATITAKIGGDRFVVVTSSATDGNYGFTGTNVVGEHKVAQELKVVVRVNAFKFSDIKTALSFNPYQGDVITADSLGTTFRIAVTNSEGKESIQTLTAGGARLKVEAPFIKSGDIYLDAYSDNGVYQLKVEDITYEGYARAGEYPLYAKLLLGTEFSGVQEIYVPITVESVKTSTVAMDVALEDTFNPNWHAGSQYESVTVTLAGAKDQVMFPDWSTIKYYTNSGCTREKPEQNIYSAGTIYAQVEAFVREGNVKDGALIGAKMVENEDGELVPVGQKITLKLNVVDQIIESVKFFYDESIGDIYELSAQERENIKDALLDSANYTGDVYAQTHVIGDVEYGINPLNYALNPDDYFLAGEWGDVVGGTAMLVTVNVAGERYEYLAWAHSWISRLGTNLGIEGRETTVYALIGDQRVAVALNIPSYEFTSQEFGDTTLEVVEGTLVGNNLEFLYDALGAWALPTSGTFDTLEGGVSVTTQINWVDDSAPNKDEVLVDEDGAYVIREYYFFDSQSIRYPQEGAFEAKIYLDHHISSGADVEVTLNDQALSYDAFSSFEYATTATLVSAGVTFDSIPVQWLDKSMPTPEELMASKFTRKAYIMIGPDIVNGNVLAQDVEIGVNKFMIQDALNGFGGNIVDGLTYTLTSENFYHGLPRVATILNSARTTGIDVELAWSENYDISGFVGEMMLTISSDYLTIEVPVNVTVGAGGILKLTNEQEFVLDPYGIEGNLFKSGELVNVEHSAGTTDVVASYNLADVDRALLTTTEDFYRNIARYFGRSYTLNLTFTYNGGKDLMSETLQTSVYVVDRTIDYISDYQYRSIVFDPFAQQDLSFLPSELQVKTVRDVDMNENVFTAHFDWEGVDRLVANNQSNTKYMAAAVVYVEDANGSHVIVDGKAISVNDFLADGGEIDGLTRVYLATQRINVPVTVVDRTIEDAEFEIGSHLEYLYTEEKYATITDTIVGVDANGERLDGRYLDIVYDRESGLPEKVVFYNRYSYVGEDKLPKQIRFTFASGDIKTYYVTYENMPTFSEVSSATSKVSKNVTIHAWSDNPDLEGVFEIATMQIVVEVAANKIDTVNSNVSGVNNSQKFYAYADSFEESAYNTALYPTEVKYFVGGKFIKAQTWWEEGRTANEGSYIYSSVWEKRHTNYQVMGGEFVEGDVTGRTFYIKNGQDFVIAQGTPIYDVDKGTYKDEFGNDLYVYIYVTTQILDASWDTSTISYTYEGGMTTAIAHLESRIDGNNCTQYVEVPIRIHSSELLEQVRADEVNISKYFVDSLGAFVVDPYDTTGIFDRVSGYSGDRYVEDADDPTGFSKDNLDGTHKLVNGEYVPLTKSELDREYVNFPSIVYIKTADGMVKAVQVVWDFNSVNIHFAGGKFTAVAIINYEGEYNYNGNDAGEQRIRAQFIVLDKSSKGIADESKAELMKLEGYNGSNTFINPYDYRKPNMPTSLSVNVTTYTDGVATGIETLTYHQKSGVAGSAGTLVWNFSSFRPTYEGGVVYVIAELTGNDGNRQKVEIPFVVSRVTASQITSIGNIAYTSKVVASNAQTHYTIDVYNGATLNIPNSYEVVFDVKKPNQDNVFGDPSMWAPAGQETRVFSSIIAVMPTVHYTVTADGITSSANGATATLQLGNQERINVTLAYQATGSLAGVATPSTNSKQLQTRITYSGSRTIPVVYYGTATEYDTNGDVCATYAVTFSSPEHMCDLPSIGDRKIVYNLTAVLGAVVDANGSVLTHKADGTPLGQREISITSISINP